MGSARTSDRAGSAAPKRGTARAAVAASSDRAALEALDEALSGLLLEAAETTLPSKIEQTVRQWLSRLDLDQDAGLELAASAMALAIELEIATPSPSGATAIDRLARRRALDSTEAAAVAALQTARFTPFVVKATGDAGQHAAEDLATHDTFSLFSDGPTGEVIGVPLFARLCEIGDGIFACAGAPIVLDDAALAVAMEFVRPGRGITHSHRCAAAVYRHVIRNGGPTIPGLDLEEQEPTEIDRLAREARSGPTSREPSVEILSEARRLASFDTILEALFKAVTARRFGEAGPGAAYRALAEAMMQALHLRSRAGSGADRQPLDRLAAIIDDEHATNDYPAEAVALFREIRGAIVSERPRASGDDLTKVIDRIRGLRAKTVDQGCTEEEALSAADKVAELLDRYGLSLGETDLRQQACLGIGIDSKRKRSGPLDDVFPHIALFCDCRSWQERADDGTIRCIFFGLPADVEAAQYLHERVAAAFETETAEFRKGAFYGSLAGGGRQKATTSFQLGLGRGIAAKLDARKVERDTRTVQATGRDLVPIKASVVEDELDKLGMAFTYKAANRHRLVLRDAFEAGRVASGRFEIQSELE